MGWTDERVELLKKLWAEGLSASQIAAELGGVTRNAVIGKVHRLGLAGRAKSTRSSTPRPRAKPRAPKPTPRLPQFSGNAALRMDEDQDQEPVVVAPPRPGSGCWPMASPTTPTCRRRPTAAPPWPGVGAGACPVRSARW